MVSISKGGSGQAAASRRSARMQRSLATKTSVRAVTPSTDSWSRCDKDQRDTRSARNSMDLPLNPAVTIGAYRRLTVSLDSGAYAKAAPLAFPRTVGDVGVRLADMP